MAQQPTYKYYKTKFCNIIILPKVHGGRVTAFGRYLASFINNEKGIRGRESSQKAVALYKAREKGILLSGFCSSRNKLKWKIYFRGRITIVKI